MLFDNKYVLLRSSHGTTWFGVATECQDGFCTLHNASIVIYFEPAKSIGLAALATVGGKNTDSTLVTVPVEYATVRYDEILLCTDTATAFLLSCVR